MQRMGDVKKICRNHWGKNGIAGRQGINVNNEVIIGPGSGRGTCSGYRNGDTRILPKLINNHKPMAAYNSYSLVKI